MSARNPTRHGSERGTRSASFRFYAELNDFLPPERRARTFVHEFRGTPSVKDTIEALGIPHVEVDLILVDGSPVDFAHLLVGGERVAVYPVFELFDITTTSRLRRRPLRVPRFAIDVHLGKLARYLRLLGFDAIYANDADDAEIAARAASERRIVLTRDVGLLKRKQVTHGYWVRNTAPKEQIIEVVRALDLQSSTRPFSRCIACNGLLDALEEREVRERLPPRVQGRYATIARCRQCHRLYWPGTHHDRMKRLLESVSQPEQR